MRYRFLALATLAILTSLAMPALAQNSALIERGMKVFAEQKCSICHSVAGKGNPKGLLDDAGGLTADDIRQWLVNPQEMREKTKAERKPPMKSFATLSKDDLDGLVAYIQSLQKK